MGNRTGPGALQTEKFASKLSRAREQPREHRGAEYAPGRTGRASMKPAEARTAFYARLTPVAEKLRRKLQRQLGNVSNSDLTERAFQALAAVSEKKQPENSAAA
jgi:hypothetical protein